MFTFRNRGERGAAAMELALLVPIFALIVSAVVELGHAWYFHHTITNASREGARFGIRHNGNFPRQCPTDEQIRTVVRNYLAQFFNNPDYLTDTSLVQVTPTGPSPSCTAGANLTVTVSHPKNWFILGPLIGLGDVTITASTTMKLE